MSSKFWIPKHCLSAANVLEPSAKNIAFLWGKVLWEPLNAELLSTATQFRITIRSFQGFERHCKRQDVGLVYLVNYRHALLAAQADSGSWLGNGSLSCFPFEACSRHEKDQTPSGRFTAVGIATHIEAMDGSTQPLLFFLGSLKATLRALVWNLAPDISWIMACEIQIVIIAKEP